MLIGIALGAFAAWQVVHASQNGDLAQLLTPVSAAWIVVAAVTALVFVVGLAAPAFTRGFAPWLSASAAYGAYQAAREPDLGVAWPLAIFALAVLGTYFIALKQPTVRRQPRPDSARVVREFVRAYESR